MSIPTGTQTKERPLAWIRQIPGDLFQLDAKPLLGTPPPFDWKLLEAEIKKIFQLDQFTIQPSEWQWRAQDELFKGIGSNLRGVPFTVVPLSGTVWCALPEVEIAQLMGLLLARREESTQESLDNDFLKAFFRFLAVETVNAYDKANADKKLSIKLNREEGLPTEACLCCDLTISIQKNYTAHVRLFLNSEFRRSWAQHYQPAANKMLSEPIADNIDVVVHLEGGELNMKPSEWKQVRPGDFVILDRCLLDPDDDKGRVHLTINHIPYFRAKIKQGSLKILEHPLHYEVTMNDTSNDDEDFEIEEPSAEHHASTEEDFEIEEEEPKSGEHPASPPKEAAKAPTATAPGTTTPPISGEVKSNVPASLDEVPLPIIVEVGRLQMSIKKLLELQPGNMLDLNIHPEAGVDLVVHGKRIAKAELLRIGDSLGVRILEIS